MIILKKILQKPASLLNLFKILPVYKTKTLFVLDTFHLIKAKVAKHRLTNGLTIFFRPKSRDSQVINEMFVHDIYAYPGVDLTACETCIDIGAHIGIFSLLAAQSMKKGTIYAFEPMKQNVNLLEKNSSYNHFRNIISHHEAVADKKGSMKLYYPDSKEDSVNFSLYRPSKKYEVVKTTTLSDIFKKYKLNSCDLLKLDCEGAEFDIIDSLPKAMLKSVRWIVGEHHDKQKMMIMKKYLEREGFTIALPKNRPGLFYGINKNWKKLKN